MHATENGMPDLTGVILCLRNSFGEKQPEKEKLRGTGLRAEDEKKNLQDMEILQNHYFSDRKYSFTSLTTVPARRNRAIRLGIAISPLNVSAMLQSNPRSIVAPKMATSE